MRRVHLFLRNSPEFLRHLSSWRSEYLRNPMFYLDAHWYEYLPLPEELNIISKHFTKGIVVIDDFYISENQNFGYDQYGSQRLDIDLIKESFCKNPSKLKIYYPTYHPDLEAYSSKRGMCVVLFGQNQDLPNGFPFSMLIEAH